MSKLTKSDTIKKESVIAALEQSLGVVTAACKLAKVSRSTFYKWVEQDKDFARSVSDISNIALDFAESQLFRQIKEGNTAATIFYLKTKGKARGYVERIEQAGPDGGPIKYEEVKDGLRDLYTGDD